MKSVLIKLLIPSQHQSAPPPNDISSLTYDGLLSGFAELLMNSQSLNVQLEWCFTAPPAISAVLLMKVTSTILGLISLWLSALIAPP